MNLKNIKKKELMKFLVGGGSGVIVDYAVYAVLVQQFGVYISVAKAISFIMGSIVGFIINKFWTFESKKFLKSEILRYIILYSITAIINTTINRLVIDCFGFKIFAFLCATTVSTILNFLGQKFFVFRKEFGET